MLNKITLLVVATFLSTFLSPFLSKTIASAEPVKKDWTTIQTYSLKLMYRDIPYRALGHCIGDLSIPNREEACPVVILVHGGGWRGGDKSDPELQEIVTTLIRRGYAVFNINYRLSWQGGKFPKSVNDVIASAHFLAHNSQKYQLDPLRIAIVGESAGGNLALMAGYNAKNSLPPSSEEPEAVQAVVAFCPVIEMASLDKDFVMTYMDDTAEHAPELYRRASPSSYVNSAVPTLCIHGACDNLIPCTASQRFVHLLKQKNIDAKLVVLPGAGHVFVHADRTLAIDATCAFLSCHL